MIFAEEQFLHHTKVSSYKSDDDDTADILHIAAP